MSRWQRSVVPENTGCGEWKNLADWWCRRLFWSYYWRRYRYCGQASTFVRKYVEPVLKENSGNLVKAMFDYSRASAQIYRRHQIMTSLVLLLRLWPKLTDGVIQVLHSFPALFQNCCLSICANTLKNWLVKCNPAAANDFKILQVFKPPYGMLIWKQKNEL